MCIYTHIEVVGSKGTLLWGKVKSGLRDHRLWKAVQEMSNEGLRSRKEFIEKCKNEPHFMLAFGPVGDLPLHLTFLLQKNKLGRDIVDAIGVAC